MTAAETVLITDTLFIQPKHERMLHKAGYGVERLIDPTDEADLIRAITGKAGYLLGGVEQITKRVLEAARDLRAIVLCGSAYREFIPAWETAMTKGITIGVVPDGHAQAVAEWALTAALAMNRGLFMQAHEALPTMPGLENQTIGIVGLGHIGKRLALLLRAMHPQSLLYTSRQHHSKEELLLGLNYMPLPGLLRTADIVFLCVSDQVGADFFSKRELSLMKRDSLLVSFMVPGIINADDLLECLQAGKLRAISDYPMDERFKRLPTSRWYEGLQSNAFNTTAGCAQTSEAATRCLIALLADGRVHDVASEVIHWPVTRTAL